MNKFLLLTSVVLLGSSLCCAEDLVTSTGTVVKTKGSACSTMKAVCLAAGYTQDGHSKDNKGLYDDCMQPLLAGQAVTGIMIDPSIASDCKAMKAKPQNPPSQGQ